MEASLCLSNIVYFLERSHLLPPFTALETDLDSTAACGVDPEGMFVRNYTGVCGHPFLWFFFVGAALLSTLTCLAIECCRPLHGPHMNHALTSLKGIHKGCYKVSTLHTKTLHDLNIL